MRLRPGHQGDVEADARRLFLELLTATTLRGAGPEQDPEAWGLFEQTTQRVLTDLWDRREVFAAFTVAAAVTCEVAVRSVVALQGGSSDDVVATVQAWIATFETDAT